jgi:hemoglobin
MSHKYDTITPKTDIKDKNDIIKLVDAFYVQVRRDPILGPVFLQRIPNDAAWPHHLEILYSFWNSVLFAQNDYHGTPFPKHVGLGIEALHFDRWIDYFHQTIDLYFVGPKADEAKDKSLKIRMMFESKLGILKN